MTRSEAKEIIKKEMLIRFNWFDEHSLRENVVGIRADDGQWVVVCNR